MPPPASPSGKTGGGGVTRGNPEGERGGTRRRRTQAWGLSDCWRRGRQQRTLSLGIVLAEALFLHSPEKGVSRGKCRKHIPLYISGKERAETLFLTVHIRIHESGSPRRRFALWEHLHLMQISKAALPLPSTNRATLEISSGKKLARESSKVSE